MRKKFFRLSLALFALAVAITAAPKKAMAFGGNCPAGADFVIGGAHYDCSLTGPPNDCSICTYWCPGLLEFVSANFCGD